VLAIDARPIRGWRVKGVDYVLDADGNPVKRAGRFSCVELARLLQGSLRLKVLPRPYGLVSAVDAIKQP
jgi:hypothetical protein